MRWEGAQQGDRTSFCIPPPAPARGGGEGGSRSGVRVEGGDPSTTGVSSELKGVSSELTGISSELTGVSSELSGVSSELLFVILF